MKLENIFRSSGGGGRVNFSLNVYHVEGVSCAYGYLPVGADYVYMHVVENDTDYMADVDRRVFVAFLSGEISAADLCDVVVETALLEAEEDEDGCTIVPIMSMEEIYDFLCVA